jgi:hypothetical protein
MILAEISVKKYIRHYLQQRFGDPTLLTKDHQIGKYLYQLLGDACTRNDSDFKPYKDTLTVKITEDVFLRKGYLLTATNVINFNNFVEEVIKNEMFLHIDVIREHRPGIKIKSAIEHVMQKMLFDENVFPYETMKKSYDRYRLKKNGEIVNRISAR